MHHGVIGMGLSSDGLISRYKIESIEAVVLIAITTMKLPLVFFFIKSFHLHLKSFISNNNFD